MFVQTGIKLVFLVREFVKVFRDPWMKILNIAHEFVIEASIREFQNSYRIPSHGDYFSLSRFPFGFFRT